jgi:pimeloyl-ACP methyl ester carboxylesterase
MRRTTHRWVRRLALLGVLWLVAGCEADQADQTEQEDQDAAAFDPSFTAADGCFGLEPDGVEPDEIACGMVEVPLYHDEPDGETIELATVVFPGDDPESDEPPVLVLGGGPGEALVEIAVTNRRFRDLYDAGPDLIVVDQRGVGSSAPALTCPEVPDLEAQQTADEDLEVLFEALEACHRQLVDEGVDLDAFHHLANARDGALIRRALGHDRLHPRGGSYGTQVALLAAEADPGGVRSLILSSPVDPTENWVEAAGAGLEAALDAVVAACAQDATCSAEFGDLEVALSETAERLDADPQKVTVTTPQGEEVTSTFTPSTFLGSVTNIFYLGEAVTLLPALIDRAHDGELEPLATIAASLAEQVEDVISTGMQFSMLCSGEAGAFDPEKSLQRLDDGLIEEYWFPASPIGGRPTVEACEIWDVEQTYEPGEVTLDSGVPALIVTGAFDHVTPPRFGERLDQALDTSHLVEVPVAGHGPLEALGACGQQLVEDFLADPDTPPDDGCATGIPLVWPTELPPGLD